jgi:uncharacterized protein YjbI with pentapeptide repeats
LVDAYIAGRPLRNANLQGANLKGATLRYSDLAFATLRGANLEGANLICAELPGADLRGANLRGANLSAADLTGADLEGADLTGADLTGAKIMNAYLMRAKITREQIHQAVGMTVAESGGAVVPKFLEEISFRLDVEVNETPENRDMITARLDQLASDVANLAGISKQETPAKTVLAAIEASNLTSHIMEMVCETVLECADME